GATLRDGARILPDSIRLVHRLARDRNLSRGVRLRLALLLAYLAIPIDLVPDFIPLIGYADDAIVMGIVLRSVIRRAGPEVVRQHWPGSDETLHALRRLCRLPALCPAPPTSAVVPRVLMAPRDVHRASCHPGGEGVVHRSHGRTRSVLPIGDHDRARRGRRPAVADP